MGERDPSLDHPLFGAMAKPRIPVYDSMQASGTFAAECLYFMWSHSFSYLFKHLTLGKEMIIRILQ